MPKAKNAAPPSPRRRTYVGRLDTVSSVRRELARLYRLTRQGGLSVADCAKLAHVLSVLSRMLVDTDLEERLSALEAGKP